MPEIPFRAPRASILIPTCGRELELVRCLERLYAEIARSGVAAEILTIHAPGDEAAIAAVQARFPAVRALTSPRRNLSCQRNLGARAARAELLVFFDDDAWPSEGWLGALLSPFEDPRLDAVGGLVRHPDGSVQYGRMATTRSARPFALAEDAAIPPHAVPLLPGGNLAIRRSTLFTLGGFDENLAYHFDDVELALRLAREERRVAYSERAAIYHESAPGPHRRSWHDRDWHTVAKNGIYVGLVHGPRTLRGWLAPLALQIPKSARLLAWGCTGRLLPHRALRAFAMHACGIVAGYAKYLAKPMALPLCAEEARATAAFALPPSAARPIPRARTRAPQSER
ncbi:MAG: glycosyltransferase [Planctomycetes bacterium]|nr:glycosyltransferase [Planctomycetota bacterium]